MKPSGKNNNPGIVYMIPVPIASSDENKVTSELESLIQNLDYYAVENLRTARRFISSLKLGINIEGLEFLQLDKRSQESQIEKMLQPVIAGRNIGVMSESGCPGIADPGSGLVKIAHRMGIKVIPLIGPSSIVLSLMASGLNGQNFRFHGYLPVDVKELRNKLRLIESDAQRNNEAQIFIETPYRNDRLLKILTTTLQQNTRLCIAKDITGPNEFIRTKAIGEWSKNLPAIGKTPTVFLIQ